MSDEELLVAFAATGSGDLFAEIVFRFGGLIRRASSNLLMNWADVEDATQDTLVHIWRNAAKFSAEAKASTWIWQIAVNAAIDKHRRRTAKKWRCQMQVTDFALENSRQEKPDRAAEAKEDATSVRSAVSQLAPRLRSVVELVDLEERPYKAAADELGINLGTLKSRRNRAIELLAEMIPAPNS